MIERLDHVNVRTANLEGLLRFYTDVLGMRQGERPPLGFPGAWLYAGERAVIHLVGVSEHQRHEGALRLEHFAFSARGPGAMVARLTRLVIDCRPRRQAGTGTRVINLRDPDG